MRRIHKPCAGRRMASRLRPIARAGPIGSSRGASGIFGPRMATPSRLRTSRWSDSTAESAFRANALENLRRRHLQTYVERTELGKLRAHFIKTHLVDNALHMRRVV